ncbi:MAG: hypothetical protein QXS38_00925 [Candidatus Pacearchaeota archaeon]
MAKGDGFGIVMWIVNTLVSLAVGFGLISGTLGVPYIPLIVMQIAGWIVVIGIIIGVVSAIMNAAK